MNNKKQSCSNRKSETPSLLSKLETKHLLGIQMTISRNVPGTSHSRNLIRSIDEPEKLKIHKCDKITKPIFARNDIVVNKYIIANSPDKQGSRDNSSKVASTSRKSRSISPFTNYTQRQHRRNGSKERSISKSELKERRNHSKSPKRSRYYRRSRSYSPKNHRKRSSSGSCSPSQKYKTRPTHSPRREVAPKYKSCSKHSPRRTPSPSYKKRYNQEFRSERYSRRTRSPSPSRERTKKNAVRNKSACSKEKSKFQENYPVDYSYYYPAPMPHLNYFGRGVHPAVMMPRNFMMPGPAYGMLPRPYMQFPVNYHSSYRPNFTPRYRSNYQAKHQVVNNNQISNSSAEGETGDVNCADSTVHNKL